MIVVIQNNSDYKIEDALSWQEYREICGESVKCNSFAGVTNLNVVLTPGNIILTSKSHVHHLFFINLMKRTNK